MKVSQEKANQLIVNAHKVSGRSTSYRFGQSLFNSLPDSLQSEIANTDKDFYHMQNTNTVINMFYDNCVDGGEKTQ